MQIGASIKGLETDSGWTAEVGPTINPAAPRGYQIVQLPDGLKLYCCGDKYSGWLAKHVAPLIYPFPHITFRYRLTIDDATLECAQVIETDSKITDAAGYTYDLSAQWNLQEGWMFQVDSGAGGWVDSGLKIAPLAADTAAEIEIDYELDYANHTSSVVAVALNGVVYPLAPALGKIPAKQVGWGPNKIVTQLQQCINGQPGAYSVKFANIDYVLA